MINGGRGGGYVRCQQAGNMLSTPKTSQRYENRTTNTALRNRIRRTTSKPGPATLTLDQRTRITSCHDGQRIRVQLARAGTTLHIKGRSTETAFTSPPMLIRLPIALHRYKNNSTLIPNSLSSQFLFRTSQSTTRTDNPMVNFI